jgi:Tfp pilus assembly protein PilV
MLKSGRTVGKTERGETIVEVLIAVAVISLTLTAAYVSANHSLNSSRDTLEHSQALQLVQAQIEDLRAHNGGPDNGDACFDGTGISTTNCAFDGNGSVAVTGTEPSYQLSITPDANKVYTITAVWDSVFNGATNNVSLYYGIN